MTEELKLTEAASNLARGDDRGDGYDERFHLYELAGQQAGVIDFDVLQFQQACGGPAQGQEGAGGRTVAVPEIVDNQVFCLLLVCVCRYRTYMDGKSGTRTTCRGR